MTGIVATIPKMQFDSNGLPLIGGTITTYLAGTTTLEATFQDKALTINNTNPIVLDARGECVIWLNSNKLYKFVLKDASGVTLWTSDNIGGNANTQATNILVLGDSTCAQNTLLDRAWPKILEESLNGINVPVSITTIAINATSFYRANTTVQFGSNTMVQQAIALNPDIVITDFGVADTLFAVDGRSSAQIQADATSFFSTLRAGLPSAKVVYAGMRFYNATDYTPASLKNQGVLPMNFQLKTAGILTGMYCSEMLGDSVSATTITRMGDWQNLYNLIASLGTVDTVGYVEYWKIARLGGINADGTHPTEIGSVLQAGYVQKILLAASWFNAKFPTHSDQLTTYWNDPDTLFSNFLTSAGSGVYTTNVNILSDTVSLQYSPERFLNPDTWYFPYKTKFAISPLTGTFDPQSITCYSARGAKPNSNLLSSLNGAAFAASSVTTDASGFMMVASPTAALNFAAGSYTLRYQIGNEVYGPYTFVVSANTMPMVEVIRNSNLAQANNAATLVAFNSVTTDRASEFNTGTSLLTCTRPGRYSVQAQVALDSGITANSSSFVQIYKNGVNVVNGTVAVYSTLLSGLSAEASTTLLCAVGDTISIKSWYTGSGTVNITAAGGQGTKLTASWIGV